MGSERLAAHVQKKLIIGPPPAKSKAIENISNDLPSF